MAILTILTIGCVKQNQDNTKPSIDSFELYNVDPNVGGNFYLISIISDDKLLGSYKIEVYDDFGFEADSIEETTRLSLNNVITLPENIKVHSISETIAVPGTTSAGPYKISLEVLDAKGNLSSKQTKRFEVLNPSDQPSITLTFPKNDTTYNGGNDTLYVQGSIMDNAAIKSATFKIAHTNGYTTSLSANSILQSSWDISNDGEIKLPLNANTGKFTLVIEATDTSGNMKRSTTSFTKN